MDLKHFAGSPAGRIANATLGFALVAAGALALASPAQPGAAIGAILMLCGVGSIFSVGLAIEDHGWEALALLLSLPFLAGPYAAGLFFVVDAGTAIGAFLVAVGIAPIWIAAGGHRMVARLGHTGRPALQT